MKNKYAEILLIEDNPLEAELTIRGLSSVNLEKKLLHLTNGPDAVDFIFAKGQFNNRNIADAPKLILLDINIPKINGLEILKKIKSDQRTRGIPVIMFTTSRESEDISASYALGANSYIVKPVDYSVFTTTIAKLGDYWTNLNQIPFNLSY